MSNFDYSSILLCMFLCVCLHIAVMFPCGSLKFHIVLNPFYLTWAVCWHLSVADSLKEMNN